MKKRNLILTFTMALVLLTFAPLVAEAQESALAFMHVTVIDVAAGRAEHDLTVLISGNRIAAVVLNGRYLPKGRLQSMLADVEAVVSKQ